MVATGNPEESLRRLAKLDVLTEYSFWHDDANTHGGDRLK